MREQVTGPSGREAASAPADPGPDVRVLPACLPTPLEPSWSAEKRARFRGAGGQTAPLPGFLFPADASARGRALTPSPLLNHREVQMLGLAEPEDRQ
jgi:hypothetical protein